MEKINLLDNSTPNDCIQNLLDNGNLLFDNAFPFSEGFARVVIHDKYTFIDKNGKLIDNGNLWFDCADDFYGGFARIKIDNKWYKLRNDCVLCNENTKEPIGQLINDTINEEYTYVIPDGYYVVIKDNKVIIKK